MVVLVGCGLGSKQKPGKFLERGKALAEQKDYARAILQFQNEVKVLPKGPEAYYQLGLAYLGLQNGRAAYGYFKKTLEIDPQHQGAQLKLAEMMALSPDKTIREEAVGHAQAVLERQPEDPEAQSALAMTDYRAGDKKAAAERLAHILETAPQHVKSALFLASLKTSLGDPRGAEEVLKTAVARNPGSAMATVALGRFYLRTSRPAEAEKQFEQAVKNDPNDLGAVWELAQLQLRFKKTAAAEENIRRLAASSDRQYRPLHAALLYSEGKRDAAIEELKKLHEKDPLDRRLRTFLVNFYLDSGRTSEAERIVNAALKENNKDTAALLERARMSMRRGKYEQAQNDLNEVVRVEPESARAHELLAALHGARGRDLNQRQELAEAVKLSPASLDTRIGYAAALTRSHDAKSALEVMNGAPQGQKRDLRWIVGVNEVLWALDDKAALRKSISAGLALSRAPELLLQDAILRQSQKDYMGARSACEVVLSRSP
jgi:tetratricopeptide (TPR) repeat protein